VNFTDSDIQTIYSRLGVPIQADACLDGVENTEEEFKRRLKIAVNDVAKSKKEIALGWGDVAIGVGYVADMISKRVLIFERNKGTGKVGEDLPNREVDLDEIDGFYVSIHGMEAFEVLEKKLAELRKLMEETTPGCWTGMDE
jgi:hypothetical protein